MGITGLGRFHSPTVVAGTERNRARFSAQAAVPDGNRDTVELGDETGRTESYVEVNGRKFSVSDEIAELHERVKALNQARFVMEAVEHNAETAKQQAKAVAEAAKAQAKALEIYRRIATGGRVTPEDEDFLQNFSPEMYMAAKMAALTAKEHKDYDSVLDDEEEASEVGEESAEAAPVSDGDAPAADAVSVETPAE